MQTGALAGSEWGFCASDATLAGKGAATASMTALPRIAVPPPQALPLRQSSPAAPPPGAAAASGPREAAPSPPAAALLSVQVAERGTINGTACRLPVFYKYVSLRNGRA